MLLHRRSLPIERIVRCAREFLVFDPGRPPPLRNELATESRGGGSALESAEAEHGGLVSRRLTWAWRVVSDGACIREVCLPMLEWELEVGDARSDVAVLGG